MKLATKIIAALLFLLLGAAIQDHAFGAAAEGGIVSTLPVKPLIGLGECAYELVDIHLVDGTRCDTDEVMVGKDEARVPHLLRCAKIHIQCRVPNCTASRGSLGSMNPGDPYYQD